MKTKFNTGKTDCLTAKGLRDCRNYLIEHQDNKCALTGLAFGESNDRQPRLDHSHSSGYVRAVICNKANIAEGLVRKWFGVELGIWDALEVAELIENWIVGGRLGCSRIQMKQLINAVKPPKYTYLSVEQGAMAIQPWLMKLANYYVQFEMIQEYRYALPAKNPRFRPRAVKQISSEVMTRRRQEDYLRHQQ